MHTVKVKSRSGHSAHLPQSLKLLMLPWPLEVSTTVGFDQELGSTSLNTVAVHV